MTPYIFLDSGNPQDTEALLAQGVTLDGQTTNPSLLAKNQQVLELKAQGRLTQESLWSAYQQIIDHIHTLLPEGQLSAEVYADDMTSYENLLTQAQQIATWFPGIYVKLPITHHGLRVAHTMVGQGYRVNMTLCFSQEQAAAVHHATLGATEGQVVISPFIGRLDDIGVRGSDVVKNILHMYHMWGSHVRVLAASIRTTDHILLCKKLGVYAMTIPRPLLESWATSAHNHDIHTLSSSHDSEVQSGHPVDYLEIHSRPWEEYDINHPLTDKGLKRFAQDWNELLVG